MHNKEHTYELKSQAVSSIGSFLECWIYRSEWQECFRQTAKKRNTLCTKDNQEPEKHHKTSLEHHFRQTSPMMQQQAIQ